MIQVALIILWMACLYLLGLGATILFAPDRASRFLSAFAQSPAANLIESVVRLAVGLSFIVAAPEMDHPQAVRWFGIFLSATALLFVAAPRLHRWFARRSVPAILPFLPLLGVASITLALSFAAYLA